MKILAVAIAIACLYGSSIAAAVDTREMVEMPEMMRAHMLANMRDHLVALDEILSGLAAEDFDAVAAVAENRLGMSSLDDHGAEHMAKRMPQKMRTIGNQMHRAASRLALRAEEGELRSAYQALKAVTEACVTCHASYRVH